MSNQSVKQQIVDKIKNVDTVLIAVSSNPTVDELSAALGFTMLLNKLNKHATAVFSGDIPSAINFLNPEKTFENTVDSLRDFIIALDKEKADHLRYKVDGEMVKIFITPYRTTIDEDDLEYSQGDYNVEMVMGIGVKNATDLDKALTDHGRIMHDATVVSLSIGDGSSDLGSINWHEAEANSYSEVLVGLSEALRSDKKLIDERIATAYLTGIVSATDRFANDKTSSNIMTVAAQLMAAGANQQLIATKLDEAEELQATDETDSSEEEVEPYQKPDGTTRLDVGVPSKVDRQSDTKKSRKRGQSNPNKQDSQDEKVEAERQDGAISIDHTSDKNEPGDGVESKPAEDALAESLAASHDQISTNVPSLEDIQKDLRQAADHLDDADDLDKSVEPVNNPEPSPAATPTEPAPPVQSPQLPPVEEAPAASSSDDLAADALQFEPTFGGTLNATSEQAAAEKRREEKLNRNRTILSHDSEPATYLEGQPAGYPVVNSYGETTDDATAPTNEPLEPSMVSGRGIDVQPATMPALNPLPPPVSSQPTLQDVDSQNRDSASQAEAAKADIEQAFQSAPPQPLTPTLPALEPAPGGDFAGAALPPMPDFSTLPPLPNAPGMPPEPLIDSPSANPAGLPTVSPVNIAPPSNSAPQPPSDPGQFQIPGQ